MKIFENLNEYIILPVLFIFTFFNGKYRKVSDICSN